MKPLPTLDARIRRYDTELRSFLERRAPGDGEELAQEVWLRLARALPHCPTDEAFRAYAYTTARRLLVDHHRRRAARVALVPLAGGEDPRAPDATDGPARAADVLAVVERTLATLKPEVAEVFRVRTSSDVSFREIALRQGVPLNTALGRMHQASQRIRAALAEAGLLPTEEQP